jgi:hypothetical protein
MSFEIRNDLDFHNFVVKFFKPENLLSLRWGMVCLLEAFLSHLLDNVIVSYRSFRFRLWRHVEWLRLIFLRRFTGR